jgi:hypothetical protein
MEDVLSDAYNLKTKIPLKILVNRFMISAYSFKRVTIVIIKTTSRRMQIMENTIVLLRFLFSLFLLKYLVSYIFQPFYSIKFLLKFRGTYQFCLLFSAFHYLLQ